MSEFKNKNDFSVTFFMLDETILRYGYCQNIASLANWVIKNKGYYHHFNIYARRSNRFLLQVKRYDKLYRSYNFLFNR